MIYISKNTERRAGFFTKHLGITFMLCMLIASSCREQKIEPEQFGALRGMVVDIDSGNPIADVLVSTNPASSSVLTDSLGNFFFDNLPIGSASVKAEKLNYEADLEAVTIFDSDTASVVLRLILDTLNNIPPKIPINLNPSNSASGVSVPTAFRWRKSASSTARYMVLAFPAGTSQKDTLAMNLTDTTFVANDLAAGQQYFWQIKVEDAAGNEAFGPIWEFTTEVIDNPIVFARNSGTAYSVWSCDENGNSVQRLTPDNYAAWRPRWNPQRTKIAFLSTKSGVDPHIFTMNPDGSDIQQVTTSVPVAGFNILDLDFCWSPNGGQLIYMNQNRLYRINADGSGLMQFALAPVQGYTFTEVDWNGNTNKILTRLTGLNIYEGIFLEYEANGVLLSTVQVDAAGREGGPQYSIIGDSYLCTEDLAGLNALDGRQLDSHIFIKSLNGAGKTDISWDKLPGTNDLDARYSATGAMLIFTNSSNTGQGQRNLYTMRRDGEDRELFLENAEMADWK